MGVSDCKNERQLELDFGLLQITTFSYSYRSFWIRCIELDLLYQMLQFCSDIQSVNRLLLL